MERYEPANKRRRNTSSVSSARIPLKTDPEDKMDIGSPPRRAEETEKEQAAVTEEVGSAS